MGKAYRIGCHRSISDPQALAGYGKLGAPAIIARADASSPAVAQQGHTRPASISVRC